MKDKKVKGNQCGMKEVGKDYVDWVGSRKVDTMVRKATCAFGGLEIFVY